METQPRVAARPSALPRARIRSRGRAGGPAAARAGALLLVGGLTAWLAFSSGGYFADTTAVATIALVLAVLLLVMLKADPLAALSRTGMVAIGALVLLTVWTLVSAQWSGTPTRTLHEYQRTLLYLLAFFLLACLPNGTGNVRWLIRVVAIALGVATLAGLAARLDPALGQALSAPADERLSWPLGYWNALGLAGSLAIIACLHVSSDLAEPRAARVLAAAAVPALAVAVFLTLSRGAILAGVVGLVVWLVLSRGRGMPSTLVAVVGPTAYAVYEAYGATALTDATVDDAASARAGAALLAVVAVATVAGALLRALGLAADARLARARLWRPLSRGRVALVVLATAVAALGAGVALDFDQSLTRQLETFQEESALDPVQDERERLAQASANGRLQHWDVALQAWRDAPVIGHGAGTYARDWASLRPYAQAAQDGHSLYFEVLGELGLIGLGLLALALAAPVVAMVRRRSENRVLWSAALALYVTWLVRAGIDWDWEMPALTLPIIALAGAACARDVPRVARPGRERGTLRLLAGLAVLLLLITPVRVAISQRHLEDAVNSFAQGRCGAAIESSLAATAALDSHPAPFELLGYCDVRIGRPRLAVRMLEAAVRREPASWELHYGLGLVRGAAGLDPRPALRRARRLNPLEPRVITALEALDSERPAVWRRAARRLPVIVPTT